MQLPVIDVPLSLPFDMPLMAHPVVVHFAVALPLIVLLLELGNLAFKRRAISVASLGLLLLTALLFLAAYASGKTDGSEASAMLDAPAREALKAHRLLGAYLVYALLIPLLFKSIAMLLAEKWARGALIVTLVMFISFVFKQGYDGGELVYTYGVNVRPATAAKAVVADLNATVAAQAETIKALEAETTACRAKEEQSLGHQVEKALTKVKKIFVDDNATSKPDAATPAEKAADINETNGSV